MDIFCTDLDQTLIYSHKYEIGNEKRCVELYQGREVSFLTEKTYELLLKLKDRVCIVPVTTRTVEQYQRIDLGIGQFRYALACNGGVLLENGKREQVWYEKSLEMIKDSKDELQQSVRYLEQEKERIFEIRLVEDLFLFTKCRHAESVADQIRQHLQLQVTEVLTNGEKLYIVPKNLNKGTALQRLRAYTRAEKIFAAGDSAFDVPMLEQADLAAAPAMYRQMDAGCLQGGRIHVMPGRRLFSEELLEFLWGYL